MIKLTEGLQHMDLENQIFPIVTIDEYSAKSGDDDEMITVKFTTRYKEVADDLIDWVNKGYDWAMGSDASISDDDKYFVFFELQRRTSAPARIIELLIDLKPLTGLKLKDWTIQINDEEYEASLAIIEKNVILSPKAYRRSVDSEISNMKDLANLSSDSFEDQPEDIKDMKNIAGI